MDDNARLHLQKMCVANNVTDQTELIRSLKHSDIIKENINMLVLLKNKYKHDAEALHLEAMVECNFLFTYYTDIYNKIRKDDIDLKIMFQLINVLKKIENGVSDQHEASFEVGTLLKEMYVDSALRKSEKLNVNEKLKENEYKGPQIDITWGNFKKINNKFC